GPMLLGGIAAFAWSLPRNASLSFFGAFSLKPLHLVGLFVGVSVLQFLASQSVMHLVADLGGIGGGILFVRWMRRPRSRPGSGNKPARNLRVLEGGRNSAGPPRWLN